MPGNYTGGIKARDKNLANDSDFYKRIGKIGGLRKTPNGGFGSDVVGKDGLTGTQRASVAGKVGGRISRRKPQDAKSQSQREEV